jgi:hypothetical protein
MLSEFVHARVCEWRAWAIELVKRVDRTMKSAHGAASLKSTTANSVAYEYVL